MNMHNSPALSLLCAVFVVTVLSLFDSIMGWIMLLSACAIGIRFSIVFKWQTRGPSMRTINLLAVFCAIVLAYFAWQLGLMLGMLNLLVMACSLKFIALRREKDYFHLVLSQFFLIACGFIFDQTLTYTLIYGLATLLLLTSLAFYFSPTMPIKRQLQRVLLLSAQAVPIGLLIFFVFPKIGPLWQMPTSSSGSSGISETMSPGDFAELSQSADLAFRATFEQEVPAQQDRYWRALVLEAFDGQTWSIHTYRQRYERRQRQMQQEFRPDLLGPELAYQIIVEPTQQYWLFSLDVSRPEGSRSNTEIWQAHSYQLASTRPILSQTHYQLVAYPNTQLNQTSRAFDQRLNLQVPEKGNQKTREWVAKLRQTYPNNTDFIAAVLGYFRQQDFIYTLKPPLMQQDMVDKFLFEHQAGFCAHYAGAMAYVMRLAGIPTRVVVGYQGGEQHQNNYVSVYQYDAHAWIESWHDESGWQRIDPTAVVSPTRIQLGLQAAMQEEGSFLQEAPFSLAKLSNIAWINQVRLLLADMDYLWSRWVLGFNQQDQHDLIKSIIGSMTQQRLTLFGLAIVLSISILLALYFVPSLRQKRGNKTILAYQAAEQALAQLGIARPAWQGMHDFSDTVARQAPPEVAIRFKQIAHSTQCLIYQQGTTGKDTLTDIHKQVRELKKQVELAAAKKAKRTYAD